MNMEKLLKGFPHNLSKLERQHIIAVEAVLDRDEDIVDMMIFEDGVEVWTQVPGQQEYMNNFMVTWPQIAQGLKNAKDGVELVYEEEGAGYDDMARDCVHFDMGR